MCFLPSRLLSLPCKVVIYLRTWLYSSMYPKYLEPQGKYLFAIFFYASNCSSLCPLQRKLRKHLLSEVTAHMYSVAPYALGHLAGETAADTTLSLMTQRMS